MFRRSTASTERLLSDLATLCRPRHVERPRVRAERLEAIEAGFADLGARLEPAAILGTLAGLQHAEPRVVDVAAKAATQLLTRWSTRDWSDLDRRLRRHWLSLSGVAWSAVREGWSPGHVDLRLPEPEAERAAAVALLACHPNGFVRQQALGALGDSATSHTLAAATLRLDDWVPEVRRAAIESWADLLPKVPVEAVIETLPLFRRIAARTRVNADVVWRQLSRTVAGAPAQDALIRALFDLRPDVARAAFETLEHLEQAPPGGWLEAATRSTNGFVRYQAIRRRLDEATDETLDDRLLDWFTLRSSKTRHRVLDVCAARLPHRLVALARQGLLDRSRSIRCRCQEILVLEHHIDPVPIYRSCLDQDLQPGARASALLGLAETSDAQDAARFEAHLRAPHPRVRAAAVAGLGRFADPSESRRYFEFLLDPSPRVARTAGRVLERLHWTASDLGQAFAAAQSATTRRLLVKLSHHTPTWDRILFLIDASADAAPEVEATAQHHLRQLLTAANGWAHGKPSAEQMAALSTRIRFRSEAIGDLRDRLEFILRLSASMS